MSIVKPALSTEALACLEKLKLLNLWPIAAYLLNSEEGCGWTFPQAFRAIGRYKTFLFVSYLYPEVLLVPTPEIDRVWHVHILHTRQYRQDCEMLFGRFIDHEPASELWGESRQQNFDQAFAQTQALLALFEGYFTPTDSGDTPLHQASRNKSTENHLTEFSPLFKGGWGRSGGLKTCPSACGRPQLGAIASIFWKVA